MATDMVFNSHSTGTLAASMHEARERMALWIKTMRCARELGINALRTGEDFDALPLAEGYTLSRWRVDPLVDSEAQRFLRRLATNSPVLRGFQQHADRMLGAEFRFHGQDAPDLGAAYLLDGLAVSLLSDPIWDHPVLALERSELMQDGSMSTAGVEVRHAARPEHMEQHRNWIAERRRAEIVSGQALWDRRLEIFPSLDFCDGARTHIVAQGNNEILEQLKRRFADLQEYCNVWQSGAPDFSQIPGATPDSLATLERYSEERTMTCPDGRSRVFKWKVKMTPHAWRIYFEVGRTPGRLFIGPVGPHLNTVLFH